MLATFRPWAKGLREAASEGVPVLLDWSNNTSRVFQALKSTSHLLRQSTVSDKSDSSSKTNYSCCHRSDAWSHFELRVAASAQITPSERSLMLSKKSVGQRMEPYWILLWKHPIQNHPKLSITEKRRNKAKYLTWNSIRLKFVKKTSMPNPVKSLGYIKCHSSSSPRPVKSPSNSIRYNCDKISSWSRRPKTILEIRKKKTFL